MKLYASPGACSLSPHIALRELGVPFELVKVDLRSKLLNDGRDFRTISPKGYVPALELDDGTLLTEGAILVQYLADQHGKLAPPVGTMARLRLQEWLLFIATELHKGMSPLYNAKANVEFRASLRERLTLRFALLAKHLEGRAYIMDDFTVADPYAFYTLTAWQKHAPTDLTSTPSLRAYYDRLAARPAVQAALAAEAELSRT